MAIGDDGKVTGLDGVVGDGYSRAVVDGTVTATALKQTIQNVGNFYIKYTASALYALSKSSDYKGVTDAGSSKGSVYLTGFKLESMIVSADQLIDNAKVVPLVNGDSITLTNLCKAGTLSFNAARTAAGIAGGDCIAVFDYVRSQGDDGGVLEIGWRMNGKDRKIIFSGVCVQRCPPLAIAGNDVADYNIGLTYSSYSDSDSPAYNANIGSMMSS